MSDHDRTITDPMPELRKPSRSRVERLRDELLPNGAFEEEIAEALNCSERQVQRLRLPFRKIGIYDVPGSREALRSRSSTETT